MWKRLWAEDALRWNFCQHGRGIRLLSRQRAHRIHGGRWTGQALGQEREGRGGGWRVPTVPTSVVNSGDPMSKLTSNMPMDRSASRGSEDCSESLGATSIRCNSKLSEVIRGWDEGDTRTARRFCATSCRFSNRIVVPCSFAHSF